MSKILHQAKKYRKEDIIRCFKNETWLQAYLNLGHSLLTAISLGKNFLGPQTTTFSPGEQFPCVMRIC